MSLLDSTQPRLKPSEPELPPLEPGDRLDQKTFHARYAAMGPGVRAELIGGIVYMASPVRDTHSRPHVDICFWLASYRRLTVGVDTLDNSTTILAKDSEPQPDVCMRLISGGQTVLTPTGYVEGCPELVIEIASATESKDLHTKLADYEKYGATEYVVMLVRTTEVVWFRRSGGKLVQTPPDADGIYRSTAFPGLWLDPKALLAGDLNRLAAVVEQGAASPEHSVFVAKITG